MKKRDVSERSEKEKEHRSKASDSAGIEQHLPEGHYEYEHRYERGYAKEIQTPRWVEPEEFKVSRLKVEQEMVTNTIAGEMGVLRRKIVSHGKALHERRVRAEIAVLRVGDLELAALGIE